MDALDQLRDIAPLLPEAVKSETARKHRKDLESVLRTQQQAIAHLCDTAEATRIVSQQADESDKRLLRTQFDALERVGRLIIAALDSGSAEEALFALKGMNDIVRLIDDRIRTLWSRQWDARFQDVSRLSRVLIPIKALASTGREIEAIVGQVQRFRNSIPDREVLDNIAKAQSKIGTVMDKLHSAGLGSEQSEFLLKLGAGQASMADVSDSVRSWMQQIGLDNQVRISLI